jgi:hypothetical protein
VEADLEGDAFRREAGRHRIGRPARWQSTTRSPRPMLTCHAWSLLRGHSALPPRRVLPATRGM